MRADALHCQRCGEVIGIYEPMIVRAGAETWVSSRAADDRLPIAGAAHYHRHCHAATAEDPEP